jgi:hypothetical protein
MRRQSQREFKMMALSSLLLQIYSTTVLLAVTSMNIWLIIGRNVVFYRKISFTNAIIDTLGAILVAAISILNCLFEDFFYRHKVSLLRTSLNETANFLAFSSHNNKPKTVKLLTYSVSFVAFTCHLYANFSVFGFVSFKYHVMILYLMSRVVLLVLCVYDATDAIRKRLVLLPQKMEKSLRSSDSLVFQIAECVKCYDVLAESIQVFSHIYGWQIFLTYKLIVVYTVGTIYYCSQLIGVQLGQVAVVLSSTLWATLLIVSLQQSLDIRYFLGMWNFSFLLVWRS